MEGRGVRRSTRLVANPATPRGDTVYVDFTNLSIEVNSDFEEPRGDVELPVEDDSDFDAILFDADETDSDVDGPDLDVDRIDPPVDGNETSDDEVCDPMDVDDPTSSDLSSDSPSPESTDSVPELSNRAGARSPIDHLKDFLIESRKGHLSTQFRRAFTSDRRIHELVDSVNLRFCDGLQEVLSADSPPPLAWFKSLPRVDAKSRNRAWGVYGIVMEKPGAIGLLYSGSGTSQSGGVRKRIRTYQLWIEDLDDPSRSMTIPKCMLQAQEEGYTITHIVMLCTCDPPRSSEFTDNLRLMVTATEAFFHCQFWTMEKKDREYGFKCPWPIEEFDYDGLCSHNPLWMKYYSKSLLTAEETKARDAAAMKVYRKRQLEAKRQWRIDNPDDWAAEKKKKNESDRNRRAKMTEERKSKSRAKRNANDTKKRAIAVVTPEQRRKRNAASSASARKRRANETAEKKEARQAYHRSAYQKTKARQTEEQKQRRLAQTRASKQRSKERRQQQSKVTDD
ncbi:hypothetical protein OQA88_12611 [Cercophora sp. LCS_1]